MPSVADSGSSLSETVKFTLCLKRMRPERRGTPQPWLRPLPADDLVQTVDEDTGDIVVAGMQTADKAEQACDVANRIIRCVDQTRSCEISKVSLLPREMQNDTALSSSFTAALT